MGVLFELEALLRLCRRATGADAASEWQDRWIARLEWLKALCLVQHYSFENVSFLGRVAPGLIGRRLQAVGGAAEVERRSCWGWGLFCFFDACVCLRKLQELAVLEAELRQGLKQRSSGSPDGNSFACGA